MQDSRELIVLRINHYDINYSISDEILLRFLSEKKFIRIVDND